MSKSADAGMVTHLGLSATTLVVCIKIKSRLDNTIEAFTEHDKDLDRDIGDGDGTVTYQASPGYNRTGISSSNNLAVDEAEMAGFQTADTFDAADFRAGKWDRAEFYIFFTDWNDSANGIIHLRRGWLGEISWTDEDFRTELRGLMQAYRQEIIELSTPDCRADFGDTRCKIQLQPPSWYANMDAAVMPSRDAAADDTAGSPTVYNIVQPTTENGFYYICTVAGQAGGSEPTWPTSLDGTVTDGGITWKAIRAYQQTGTVSSVTSQQAIAATGISEVSGFSPTEQYWGRIEWLTGANAGVVQEVETDDGGGALTFFLSAPYTIQTGDTFRATALCRKTWSACKAFGNQYNFRGEKDVPGNDSVFDYPIAG